MARQKRVAFPGYYHVINRGVEQRQIFLDSADYKKFMSILGDAGMEYSFSLHAWALMPNHYHLLLKTELQNLSEFMKQINARYTIFFNRKYRRVGPLWQGRFKSLFVQDEIYLRTLIKYIEYNPVKSGLTDRIGDYQWASKVCRSFLSDEALCAEVSKAEIEQVDQAAKTLTEMGRSYDGTGPDPLLKKHPVSSYFKDCFDAWSRNWQIVAALGDGHRQRDVADELGVSEVLISKVMRCYRQKKSLFKAYKKKGLFWSYSKNLVFEKNTEELFYEYILKYGEFDEVRQLIGWIGKKKARQVWQEKMMADASFRKVNLLIARVFFNLDIETDFFEDQKNGRFEKLKLFAAQNPDRPA